MRHHGLGEQVQAVQGFVDALFPVPAVQRLNLALHGVQIAVALAILLNQRNHPRQPGPHRHEHGGIGIQQRLLGHIGNAGVALHLQGAVIGVFQPGQNFEQTGLASPVAPNQAHALGGFKRKISMVKQGYMPKCQLGVKKGNQCHRGGIICCSPRS